MQLTTILTTAGLLATSTLAAPAPSVASFKSAALQWTFTSLSRPCDAGDTKCTWSFAINRNDGSGIRACAFDVTGAPASRTDLKDPGAQCGPYTITTGWSGAFGEGKGFTTLAVVDKEHMLIVWPSYTDAQLAGGAVVRPDQSWDVSSI